jgi:hypothetical protein
VAEVAVGGGDELVARWQWWQALGDGGNWWQLVAVGGSWWQLVARVAQSGNGKRLRARVLKKGLFLLGGQVGQDALALGQHGHKMAKMARFGWLFERHFLGLLLPGSPLARLTCE